MDYYSIIVLVVITFIYITDRKIKTIDDLKKQNENIYTNITKLKKDLIILKVNFKNLTQKELYNVAEKGNKKYLFIENEQLKLDNEKRDILIANFVNSKKKTCGFNIKYSYINEKRISLKRILVSLINYLNIFNKNDLTTYGVIIIDVKDLDKIKFLRNKKIICEDIISYVQNKKISLDFNIKNINMKNYSRICIEKIYNASPKFILKFLLLFLAGSFIAANVIYSSINIKQGITNFVISLTIYLCYTYILKYIYEPVGKERIIASYIFPLYFIIYFFTLICVLTNKKYFQLRG